MIGTSVKLYSWRYTEVRTWMAALLFVACNIVLPQLFHLLPQGGVVFAPLSFIILVGAYKLGWRPALLVAMVSPLVNHWIFGMPAWDMVPTMVMKLAVLAVTAGWAANHWRKVTLLLLVCVVLMAEIIGGVGELVLTDGLQATIADFTIGWPGLLLQIAGGYLLLKMTAAS